MRHTLKIGLLFMFFCASFTSVNAQAYQGQLLSTWSDSTLVASNAHNNVYNEIWGFAIGGKEYAIIGTTKGTHFIDVTDPENIFEAHVIEGAEQGAQIIHRDYHDFDAYLFAVSDEGDNSTLQIMDLSFLPLEPPVLYDAPDIINQAHNIFIDQAASRLYSLSHQSNNTSVAYGVWDISDPLNPIELKKSNSFGPLFVGHVHDAYIENNIGYFNCGSDGMIIADMTDLNDIQVLSHLETSDYPDAGYNHSGWPNADGTAYFMADETHGMDVKSLDVTDKSDIQVLQQFNSESGQIKSIAHNLIVKGDYLYVAYYYDGLQVYDISDPSNVTRIMHYPTSQLEATNKYEGAWGVYPLLPSGIILVSDMQEGLFVIDNEQVSSVKDEDITLDLELFPNPTKGLVHVKNNLNQSIVSYNVIDVQSKVILSNTANIETNQSKSLNLNLEKGIYFIQFILEDHSNSTKKFVVD